MLDQPKNHTELAVPSTKHSGYAITLYQRLNNTPRLLMHLFYQLCTLSNMKLNMENTLIVLAGMPYRSRFDYIFYSTTYLR